MSNAGPPPVGRSPAAPSNTDTRMTIAVQNYQTIVATLKANNGAEAKAVRSMFGGNKQLMDRFLAVAFSLLAADNDLLQRATPMSIVEAIKRAASLGLEPMTDDAAIVRYGDKAQLLPMYKGYLKRIRRSGAMKAVDVITVYTNDEFDYGTNNQGFWFTHHPAKARKDPETHEVIASRGEYMGFCAFAIDPTGYTYGRYMDVDQVNHVRDTFGKTHTKDGKPLPWVTSYEQMALKTVVRLLAKMLPQEAVGQDFLMLEKQNDDAIAAIGTKVDDAMDEVRNLALRAVSGAPRLEAGADQPTGDTPDSADGASGPPSDPPAEGGAPVANTPTPDAGGPGVAAQPEPAPDDNELLPGRVLATVEDPGLDPNVGAAMALSDEQRRVAEFRSRTRR